jgi:hypothetical protein
MKQGTTERANTISILWDASTCIGAKCPGETFHKFWLSPHSHKPCLTRDKLHTPCHSPPGFFLREMYVASVQTWDVRAWVTQWRCRRTDEETNTEAWSTPRRNKTKHDEKRLNSASSQQKEKRQVAPKSSHNFSICKTSSSVEEKKLSTTLKNHWKTAFNERQNQRRNWKLTFRDTNTTPTNTTTRRSTTTNQKNIKVFLHCTENCSRIHPVTKRPRRWWHRFVMTRWRNHNTRKQNETAQLKSQKSRVSLQNWHAQSQIRKMWRDEYWTTTTKTL